MRLRAKALTRYTESPLGALGGGDAGAHGLEHALRRERRFAQARSRGVEAGVADGRGHGPNGSLAAADRGHLRPVDQRDLDLWNLFVAQNRIARPIEILDSRGIELYLFHERAAGALNDVAFNLILQAVGIDDQAAIVRDADFLDGHLAARSIDFDFRDHGDHGIGAGAYGHASPGSDIAGGS